jgi:hypothetical protein
VIITDLPTTQPMLNSSHPLELRWLITTPSKRQRSPV